MSKPQIIATPPRPKRPRPVINYCMHKENHQVGVNANGWANYWRSTYEVIVEVHACNAHYGLAPYRDETEGASRAHFNNNANHIMEAWLRTMPRHVSIRLLQERLAEEMNSDVATV